MCDSWRHWKMTSFIALDGVTSFLSLKDVTFTCKRKRRSLSIGWSSSVQWWKVGRSWRLRICFRRFLCVRIEIDQLQGVNCWVIVHCLSVSCTKINHLHSWFDLLYNWPPNSELLLNNSLLELIYFLNNTFRKGAWLETEGPRVRASPASLRCVLEQKH